MLTDVHHVTRYSKRLDSYQSLKLVYLKLKYNFLVYAVHHMVHSVKGQLVDLSADCTRSVFYSDFRNSKVVNRAGQYDFFDRDTL